MKYIEAFMIILYLVALLVIIIEFSGLWALAIVFLLILMICSLQKSYFDKLFNGTKEQKNRIIEIITNKLDVFSNGIKSLQMQIDENSLIIENKLSVFDKFDKNEIENTYRELIKKIFDVENKLSVVKKTLSMSYGVIDERLQAVEGALNIRRHEEE